MQAAIAAGITAAAVLSGAAGAACGASQRQESQRPPLAAEGSLSTLPVREVTVFKDGHALVVHEGRAPMNADGDVVLDRLPAPIMGTFWPYEREGGARLAGVRAGSVRVEQERSARSLAELIGANLGKRARITEYDNVGPYECTLVDLPPGPADDGGAQRIVVLGTEEGRRVVPLSRIRDVTFLSDPDMSVRDEAQRNVLTLDLDWGRQPPPAAQPNGAAAEADVGLMYVQKGLRWIPSYRIVIDEAASEGAEHCGTARLELQATLVNDLADLENVAVNLVIGVPSFAFADTLDPISMQQQVAQLSPYFQSNSQTRFALSNAIMSQTARMGEYRADAGGAGPMEPQWPAEDAALAGDQRDELFVFRIDSLTLRKGERIVVPVTVMETTFENVFSYDVPMIPPVEVMQYHGGQQEQWMQELLSKRNVMRRIRINNTTDMPITTAPALIMRGGQVLAQGMTTYAAAGGTCDVDVTAAVNIKADYADEETEREPGALRWNGSSYAKISQRGAVTLTNHTGKPVTVEVSRIVLGHVEAISHDGRKKALSLFDLQSGRSAAAASQWPYPYWAWPWWWRHVNAISEVSWEVTLAPGETAELACEWHYFAP